MILAKSQGGMGAVWTHFPDNPESLELKPIAHTSDRPRLTTVSFPGMAGPRSRRPFGKLNGHGSGRIKLRSQHDGPKMNLALLGWFRPVTDRSGDSGQQFRPSLDQQRRASGSVPSQASGDSTEQLQIAWRACCSRRQTKDPRHARMRPLAGSRNRLIVQAAPVDRRIMVQTGALTRV
jgi:hypothetical protein